MPVNNTVKETCLNSDQPTRFGSGHAVRRVEDDALLKGQGRYTDDFAPDGVKRACFARSAYPHARIVSVDTSTALAMPGVLAVLTGADLVVAGVKPMPHGIGFPRPDGTPAASPLRHLLAHERVRYVGEAVAVVVADTLQQARDAAEAIGVNYEDLPHVVTMDDAMAAGASTLCDQAPDNICAAMKHGDATATDAAFAGAAHVVKLNITNQRVAALSIEPRSVLAYPDASTGRLTMRMSTQMPTGVRNSVAGLLGLAPDQMRVIVDDVGGGFGMKTGMYAEDGAVAYCAKLLQRPVKWVADRSEEFLSSYHGRDIQTQAALALAADGKILGLRVHSQANVGAYATGTGVAIQLLIGPWVQTSVYDIQTIDFQFKAVLTNTASTGAYRGAGRPEAIHIMERLMDEAARQTGIDRVALRRRNFIQPEQMPYKNPMAQVYDTGKFEQVMDKGLVLADWNGFAAREAQSKQRGKLRGLGLATFLEWTGGNVFEERVTVTVLPDGIVEVFSAVNAMGQGIATTLAQLVVDVFGLPLDRIRIVLGDTDKGTGFGSAGSRSIFTGGSAVQTGAERTIEHAKKLAATELEASEQDVVYRNGQFSVKGTDMAIDLFALANKQTDHRIHIDSTSTVSGPTWPNGCHVSEVEIDPATGEVQVVAYASVNDVGRVINPMIVRGQLDGGAVQGMGQAFAEALVYDRETGQLVTGSLSDYTAPRADAMACMFVTEMDESTPCKNNPLGVKGVGELGTIGAGPCVVNAVADALARAGRPELSPIVQMPLTSAKVWGLLNPGA
ncbi:MAG: xanthine dehydrogenase family protein [Burkholderiaceae bacterium]|nr:xanthine dehydrogenase family protein [Burkholderiaceae bacterium]